MADFVGFLSQRRRLLRELPLVGRGPRQLLQDEFKRRRCRRCKSPAASDDSKSGLSFSSPSTNSDAICASIVRRVT